MAAGGRLLPLEGSARLRPGSPPRDGAVEVTDDRRTVTLPVREAVPLLARASARADLSPSARVLADATVLGLRLVAAGRVRPAAGPAGPHWAVADLAAEEEAAVAAIIGTAAEAGLDEAEARTTVRGLLDAVADVLPRAAPSAPVAPDGPAFAAALDVASTRPGAPTPRVRARSWCRSACGWRPTRTSSWRGRCGSCSRCTTSRIRSTSSTPPCCGPARRRSTGSATRARIHASIALRAAADAWPVLDRLLALAVPDQITLDTDELVSLLDDGVAALRRRGVDVLWPRSLGRDLTTTTVLDRRPGEPREGELVEGLLGTDALFSFHWQVALHGEPLSVAEMERLRAATGPLLRLRGQWTVVDPAVARRAKRRLVRTVTPVQAVAAALTGIVEVDDVEHDVVVGASLLSVREQLRTAATRDPIEPPAGLVATLRDYQRHGLTWLAQLTDLGLGACLADDMGLGKTVTLIALHLHRRETGRTGPTLVVCPASLLGTWESEVRRFAPGVDVRRFHGSARDVKGMTSGFVLTTYGTLRASLAVSDALREVPWDLVVADEAQHVKNPRSATARALRTVPSRARVALTGTPVENDLTELWAILDWATPGLLGSRQRVPQGVGRPDRVGTRADEGAPVRRADRPVPPAPPQVRSRRRPGASAQDGDRPRPGSDARAGGALRGVRARHDEAHRARRR